MDGLWCANGRCMVWTWRCGRAFCDVLLICILSGSKVRKMCVNLPLSLSNLAQIEIIKKNLLASDARFLPDATETRQKERKHARFSRG